MDKKVELTVQRFDENHHLFTKKVITNTFVEKGLVGSFQSVFGQLLDTDKKVLCYTLERKDTLISEGRRRFRYYDSPSNHTQVLLFENEPGCGVYDRFFEMHIANWAYQLKGCTAVGIGINLEIPMLTGSSKAFEKVMHYLNGYEGWIIHETLKQK